MIQVAAKAGQPLLMAFPIASALYLVVVKPILMDKFKQKNGE